MHDFGQQQQLPSVQLLNQYEGQHLGRAHGTQHEDTPHGNINS